MPYNETIKKFMGISSKSRDSWPIFLLNALVRATSSSFSRGNYQSIRSILECLTGCPPVNLVFYQKPTDDDDKPLEGEALKKFWTDKADILVNTLEKDTTPIIYISIKKDYSNKYSKILRFLVLKVFKSGD